MTESVFPRLAAALATPDIDEKIRLTVALAADWQAGTLTHASGVPPELVCGIPAKPELVSPRKVPTRNPKSPEGRARLLHAIVHIEFSAINLALDHAARFPGQSKAYYDDWIGVAAEEADHFMLLRRRLQTMGHDYGDFPAHAGLWAMAEKTADDIVARMALVPRLLEARGLDATPPIQARLLEAGDTESAAALEIILRDEIGHVGLGDRWFRFFCGQRGLDAEITYRDLLERYDAPWPQAPMNMSARLAAGFSETELDTLISARPQRQTAT